VPADNARPPVAVRVVRPYESDEAFLENELETVGKTSVILIGAHPRPTGVILRFEVTLAGGTTVLRGEGRVLAYKENAFRGQPGLALRFTRLDPKSKALVDRAAAIREARLARDSLPPPAPSDPNAIAAASSAASAVPEPPREAASSSSAASAVPEPASSSAAGHEPTSSSSAAASEPASSLPPPRASESDVPDASRARRSRRPRASVPPPDPVLARALTSPTPEPPAVYTHSSVHPNTSLPDPPQPADASESHAGRSDEAPANIAPTEHVGEQAAEHAGHLAAPPTSDRDALLARLRQRAAAMTDEQRAAILRLR
jgi:hypothetical protein